MENLSWRVLIQEQFYNQNYGRLHNLINSQLCYKESNFYEKEQKLQQELRNLFCNFVGSEKNKFSTIYEFITQNCLKYGNSQNVCVENQWYDLRQLVCKLKGNFDDDKEKVKVDLAPLQEEFNKLTIENKEMMNKFIQTARKDINDNLEMFKKYTIGLMDKINVIADMYDELEKHYKYNKQAYKEEGSIDPA
jgi:hypothetical protein